MVINIPLQIDDTLMEETIKKDYEGKVLNVIVKEIKATLTKASPNIYGDKVNDGMKALIENRIDGFLNEHEQEILCIAAHTLATKLARSKKGKAILDGLCADAERLEEGDK